MRQLEVNSAKRIILTGTKRDHLLSRKWINPFVKKLYALTDEIFTFADPEEDNSKIKALCLSRRVICELGSGSGKHLLLQAETSPEAICFGIELRYKRAVRTIEKAKLSQIANVYLLHVDARRFAQTFAPNSIDELYVNFPDPWEKKRQKKNRLLGNAFLESANQTLKPSGFVSIKTDHPEYFISFLQEVEANSNFKIIEQSFDLHASDLPAKLFRSEFEELFYGQGKPVHYLKLMREKA